MLKRVLKECIPAIIALTFTGLYSVIDGLFVGNVSRDTGLAAINLAWPIPAFITATGLGIGTGGSILYSNAKGRGEKEFAEKILHTTLRMLVGTALLVMISLWLAYSEILKILGATAETLEAAESYSRIIVLGSLFQIAGAGMVPLLRNLSMPLEAMMAMVIGMLTNLGLNYVLIIKVGMGIQGAAFGTIAAQCVVSMICLQKMWKKGVFLRKEITDKKKMSDIKDILKTGFPAFGGSLAPTVVLMFTNYQCLNFGGKEAVAAYAVISYIVFPIQSLLQGVGEGLQPLMSYYIGAAEKEKLKIVRTYAYRIILILGCTAFFAAMISQKQIAGYFRLSEAAGAIFREGFWISAVSFLFYGFCKFNISYLNSYMKVKLANSLIYGECLIVSPILILCLPLILGINGIWISLPVTSLIMLSIYTKGIKV